MAHNSVARNGDLKRRATEIKRENKRAFWWDKLQPTAALLRRLRMAVWSRNIGEKAKELLGSEQQRQMEAEELVEPLL